MIDRRRFLQSVVAASLGPATGPAWCRDGFAETPLRSDPDSIMDLRDGFSYLIVSRAGDAMSDGFRIPHAHDGMAAFAGEDGRVILVCNHEIAPSHPEFSAFGTGFADLPDSTRSLIYDHGASVTPGAGGTTTTVFNPVSGAVERQFLSLAGTELNCAGGPTPWGSWLSCEECFESPGQGMLNGRPVTRERSHGYVFEVPSGATGLAEPVPIKAMGKFEHEACAVHQRTGIVYMTEDRYHSLFYRYLPDVPGRLHEGGRLQALAIAGRPSLPTHNWSDCTVSTGRPVRVTWIDLDDVDPVENDLRLRGAELGAATFARGEGLTAAGDRFAFTCTIGGPDRRGQVFTYRPSPYEGESREVEAPGELMLIAQATHESLLQNADNLTMAPWGDLIICEDTADHCGLVGVRPDGSQYVLADNAYTNSELAGVCFSPDGRTLFVNIQYPGMTLAITGPWPT